MPGAVERFFRGAAADGEEKCRALILCANRAVQIRPAGNLRRLVCAKSLGHRAAGSNSDVCSCQKPGRSFGGFLPVRPGVCKRKKAHPSNDSL
jgi:hypothetical protein